MAVKILVNATTLVVGGGVQVGVAFIEYAVRNASRMGMECLFAVSEQVFENLPRRVRSDQRLYLVSPSPAKPFLGFHSRLLLMRLESDLAPDLVYSIGAPSYVRFATDELARFTDPWGTHASSLAWRSLPLKDRGLIWMLERYKLLWLRRVEYIETQSYAAARGLAARLSLAPYRIRVIPNAHAFCFDPESNRRSQPRPDEVTRILTLSAPYRHKNLEMIPAVASLLRKEGAGDRYIFVVTLPNTGSVVRDFWSRARKLCVEGMIRNVGQVKLQECVALYQESDLVFMPTLLETFSVTYLEAMAMRRPIITTDLDFARDVCGDAAAYYSPLSVKSAADAIRKVAGDDSYRVSLVDNGQRRLAAFPSPEEKYRMTLDWLSEAAKNSCITSRGEVSSG